MDSGHCDPGPGPVETEKDTATFVRRALKEAELQIELWKEQADEARKESIQLKSSVKVLHAELNVAQKELGQAQDEHKRQTELVMELRAEIGVAKGDMAGLETKLQFTERQLSLVQDQYKQQGEEIENKNKLLRDCQKAFTQVNVLIEKDLMDTEREDQLSKKKAEDLRKKSGSQSTATTTTSKDYNRGDLKSGSSPERGERGGEEQLEDKGKKRSNKDKPFPQPPQETNERSSANARDRSNSPIKRKPVPTESSQFQEPPRTLFVERLEGPGMESGSDSDSSDDVEMFSPTDLDLEEVASNLGNGSPESQLEKAKVKDQALKKKLEEMEATAYHYQKLHHQERSQHVRTYNQARVSEMEFNSARKHIHVQDEELKSVRNELAAVKQQLSDAVNLSEVRGKELKELKGE